MILQKPLGLRWTVRDQRCFKMDIIGLLNSRWTQSSVRRDGQTRTLCGDYGVVCPQTMKLNENIKRSDTSVRDLSVIGSSVHYYSFIATVLEN